MLRSFALCLAATMLFGCQQRDAPRRDDKPAPAVPTASPVDQDNLPLSEPDNTAKNARDKNSSTLTPIDQNENDRDVKLTAEIRSRINAGNFSLNARNVKVMSQNGHVTLRGPVDNAGEKEEIERIVRLNAGDNFVSEIEVINR